MTEPAHAVWSGSRGGNWSFTYDVVDVTVRAMLGSTTWTATTTPPPPTATANATATAIAIAIVIAIAGTAGGAGCAAGTATTSAHELPTRTGSLHDFDYFAGGWTTAQHRLDARGTANAKWEDFPGTLCATPHLDGMITADELVFPTKGWSGFTLRTFDVAKQQWSVYWISSKNGRLQTPVVGGFTGDNGEFYGEDDDNGRHILVRYRWTKVDHDHATWEQAFSYDRKVWEVNWTADFTRADATVCENGRPRGSDQSASSAKNAK